MVAVLAVVGTAAIVVGQRDAAPVQDRPLVTDVVTEDAVVAVLELYAAEVAMADAVAGPDPFALPGPVGRSLALAEAQEAAQSALTEIRDADVGPGTPALVYADHPDHDALLQVADRVLADTRALASLEGIHQTLLGGAPVTTPAQSAAALDAVLADPAADAGLRGWADALRQLVAGGGDPAVAAAARAEAAAAWRQSADRLGAAALADLTAFLNGIDPGVLAALDGHPVAGPALARLRRSDDASARLRRSGRRAHPHG